MDAKKRERVLAQKRTAEKQKKHLVSLPLSIRLRNLVLTRLIPFLCSGVQIREE